MTDDTPTPADRFDAYLAAEARPRTREDRLAREAERDDGGSSVGIPAILGVLAIGAVVLVLILGTPHLPAWIGR